ncbi:hypothetical protein BIY45_03200 [Stenotrophomonas sp. BIIR7]|nr:hypothetical protein BIY45_03200 [Stenotrophomonas sp. BIIR7]
MVKLDTNGVVQSLTLFVMQEIAEVLGQFHFCGAVGDRPLGCWKIIKTNMDVVRAHDFGGRPGRDFEPFVQSKRQVFDGRTPER